MTILPSALEQALLDQQSVGVALETLVFMAKIQAVEMHVSKTASLLQVMI